MSLQGDTYQCAMEAETSAEQRQEAIGNELKAAAHRMAFGLLWMKMHRGEKDAAAYKVLSASLTHEERGSGIKAAIDAGYEADHPEGADYWAGKK